MNGMSKPVNDVNEPMTSRNEVDDSGRRPWKSRLRSLAKEGLTLAAVIAFTFAARSTFADHYTVPSGSMEQTLQVGDRVLVDKTAYGVRIPFTELEIVQRYEPARGEVVILDSPTSGVRLIKRVWREIVIDFTVEPIARANLQFLKPVEHIEFGEGNAGNARNGDRLAYQNGIKPAAATMPACDSTEFMTALAQLLAGFVFEFGRERTSTHTGCIGFDDAENEAGCLRSNAGTTSRRARDGV